MTNFIPIFPLTLVVYPGEQLNLHIFEPRYIQLIRECFKEEKAFGIPTVLPNRNLEYGTLVKVTGLVKEYNNGELDITTRGLEIFRVLELIKTLPDKLYMGAIVNYPDNVVDSSLATMNKILVSIREMHQLLNVSKDFKKPDEELESYDVAHHIGLTLEQEYELLTLFYEAQRQEYIKRHLKQATTILKEVASLKEKIKLNGHFKNPGPTDYDWLK